MVLGGRDASQGPLGGLGVLVTRPRGQGERLCRLVEGAGGRAVHLPVLEIRPPEDPERARAALEAGLAPGALAIFVSANAVRGALALRPAPWPVGLELAAVGRATAGALEAAGLAVGLVAPPPHDSEALLGLPALRRVEGRPVLLVRGAGGRELLARELAARGARLQEAVVYRRARPERGLEALDPAVRRALGAVVVTSGEALGHLLAMAREAGLLPWLLGLRLAAISARVAEQARAAGFRSVAVAPRASDEGLLEGLLRALGAGGGADGGLLGERHSDNDRGSAGGSGRRRSALRPAAGEDRT